MPMSIESSPESLPEPPTDGTVPVNAGLCPLCGRPNTCAMELARTTGKAQPPCWCTAATFDPAALARIPAAAQGLACLCPACARSAVAAV